MKMRRKTLLTAILSVGVLTLLLGAAAGSQTDPLVTMSYLNDINTPAILKQVDAKLDSREQALVDKLNGVADAYSQEVEALISVSGGTSTGAEGASAVFSVVTVKAGQQLLGTTGCELLLRSGSATCVASSAPGLVDSTEGSTLDAGGSVQPNHLYLVTADGRGLKASADATVLVRGSYTIS